ncbi:helix-turn-helix domain-containing protein [Nitrospirillum viridazoti]|uniref:helix-turn-helix domain-containing protein n=1 Tax=Nitrospirillum viridazoti TaxID=3144925 RepID=UPI0009D9D50F
MAPKGGRRLRPSVSLYSVGFATACFARVVDDIRIQFGRLLRQQRKAKSLTHEELAGRVGMAVPYLSDLERGRGGSQPCDDGRSRPGPGLGAL